MKWQRNDLYRPAKAVECLVLSKNKAFHVLKYDPYTGLWNANCDKGNRIEVECWTYLPSTEEIMTDIKE